MIWLCDVKYSAQIFDFASEWRLTFDHRNLNMLATQIEEIQKEIGVFKMIWKYVPNKLIL